MLLNRTAQRARLSLATTLLCLATLPAARAEINASTQMLLGNPDKAATSTHTYEHYLIQRPQYSLSYNAVLRFPNWVAWKLDASDIGSEPRGQFQPDTTLPLPFTRVTPSDYTRSGYDRGHNCPSKDRSASPADNAAVFLMTNMTPQAHGMNAGPWEQLETYSRQLAQGGNSLYIVAGHFFSSPKHKTIGRAAVAVPDFGWKIVVVAGKGKKIDASSRVIAVKMPNNNTISKRQWTEFVTTPAELEKATGFVFFDALPKDVAAALRTKRDGATGLSGRSDDRGGVAGKLPDGESKLRGDVGASGGSGSTAGEAGKDKVWVNTKSGAYWKPGTQYYGKTKQGKYMSEADAIKAGYHAAGGQ